MIESLKESNKNLQEELVKKNLIIQQNQNIEKKIFIHRLLAIISAFIPAFS